MTDIIKSVRDFTQAIGCTTDQYNARQTALYIGLQLEEMAEKLEAMATPNDSGFVSAPLRKLSGMLNDFSADFKAGNFDAHVARADRSDMLDADVDLAWVTIGSMLSQGVDVEGACGEVERANMAKLVLCDCKTDGMLGDEGVCELCAGLGLVAIKDADGKVKKPEGWTAPDIEPFVCKAEGGKA